MEAPSHHGALCRSAASLPVRPRRPRRPGRPFLSFHRARLVSSGPTATLARASGGRTCTPPTFGQEVDGSPRRMRMSASTPRMRSAYMIWVGSRGLLAQSWTFGTAPGAGKCSHRTLASAALHETLASAAPLPLLYALYAAPRLSMLTLGRTIALVAQLHPLLLHARRCRSYALAAHVQSEL